MLYCDEQHPNLFKSNAYHLELLVSKQGEKIGWDFGMSPTWEYFNCSWYNYIVLDQDILKNSTYWEKHKYRCGVECSQGVECNGQHF